MTTDERNERADALLRDLTAATMVKSGETIHTAGSGSGWLGNYQIQGEGIRHFDTGAMAWTWLGKRRMARVLAHFA